MHTDNSDYAIGCVLTQKIDGYDHPITFLNRLLTSTERKWSTSEKECLAVLWSVEKLRPYIEGYDFTVITDHSSLQWLKNIKDPTGRLGRWALKLLAYQPEIVHRAGAEHHVPDALSRAFENQVASMTHQSIRDPWYFNKFRLVKNYPDKYPDWQIKDNKLYFHKPHPWIDPLMKDLNKWKLVLPEERHKEVMS